MSFRAFDTPAHVVSIAPHFSKDVHLSTTTKNRYVRLSAHLSSAIRLRRKLVSPVPPLEEAVLSPSGQVAFASGDARDALDALRRAVIDRDRARTRAERSDYQESALLWQGLVSGRWTLIDRFEENDKRFVVALRNENTPREQRLLTPQEELVAQLASRGDQDKDIAYALGIAPATVQTHLKSVLRKFGRSKRIDLLMYNRRSAYELTLSIDGTALAVLVAPRAAPQTSSAELSAAELDIRNLLAQGLTNQEIANRRGTSINTVAKQVAHLLSKMGTTRRALIADYADMPRERRS